MGKVQDLKDTQLGQKTHYSYKYNPDLLQAIPRSLTRENYGILPPLPFQGFDIWNCYELSWLNPNGVPRVALLELWVPCHSPCLVESKSLKVYLNSFNNSYFKNEEEIQSCIQTDLEKILETPITCHIKNLSESHDFIHYQGYQCLDKLPVNTNCYEVNPDLIRVQDSNPFRQKYYSDILRTCCPVTQQPDWATLFIDLYGPQIEPQSLLQYLISFRNTQEFHEACVEHVFADILRKGQAEKLCVYARFTRRGGIDINPLRYNFPTEIENDRTHRQ